jgi:hypothetical protein
MVDVEAKHGRTARKKLLTLIRNPESGAAGFVAEHPGITSWSVATGRAFLQDILELPSERLPPNAETSGLALLDIDAKYAAEDPSIAALPSILKARLLFHCELLRAVSSAEEADSKRALAQAEQWEREAAKAAAREKAREEARAEGWLPMPSTKKAGGKRPASGGAAVSMERQQAVAPKADGKSAKRSRVKRGKPTAAQEVTAAPAAGRPFREEGGWLGDGLEAYPGLRVQVAHFSDLVESLKETSSKSLAPAELTMARRSAASRGTIIVAGGKGASKLTVQLDDGLEAQLPHAALYALPSLVLHPAQLRTGATARVVHARWLRQLLLCADSESDDGVDVGALSERLGGALVTVTGVEDLRLKHRVRVAAADGFEATVPQDALVPPPQNAHAVRLLNNRAPSVAAAAAPHRAAAPPEIGEPGFEKRFAAAVAAPRKTPQQQPATSAKSMTGSVNGRSLYRDTSGGTGNVSSAANMSQHPDPSVGDYEAIQGDLDDHPTLRKTIVPMVAVGKNVPPEHLEYVFPPAPRVPTAPGTVPEEMLRDGRVLSDAAVDISVTGSGLGVHLAHDLQGPGRGTYNRAIDEPKRMRPTTAGVARRRKNWAPVNMKVFGFNELENDSAPNPRGAPDGYDGDMFEGYDFEDDGDIEGGKKFPHPWKPAGSGKNAIDAIYNPASNANGAPQTADATGKNDGSESEPQPPTPIRRRPASARTRRPKGANQAGGAAWAAVRGSGDRPMTAGSSKRGLRDMPAEGLQRSTSSDLTKRQLTPQEQALLASEAIKMDKSGRAVWRPAGSGKAAIDAIYNPAAASNLGLRHDHGEEDDLVAAANAAEQARASLPYSPAPYASTGRAFPAGSVWTRSEENLHGLLSPEKDGTLRKSTTIHSSEDENDSNESKGRRANASAKVSATAAPPSNTSNQRDPDDPVVRLSQASAAIPDRDLRQRLQRMDEELAERQTAQMDKFQSRQKVGAVDSHAIELNGVDRAGVEHDLDGRVAAMEHELEERETELRDGPAPKKDRREAAADRHRATLMEETDERLRRQMARMDDQMQKKEQEIREAEAPEEDNCRWQEVGSARRSRGSRRGTRAQFFERSARQGGSFSE